MIQNYEGEMQVSSLKWSKIQKRKQQFQPWRIVGHLQMCLEQREMKQAVSVIRSWYGVNDLDLSMSMDHICIYVTINSKTTINQVGW